MLFGHNTDLKIGETVYHLQTEDRGVSTALIDTTVYCRGRVVHRRTNNYFDLLPLEPAHEESLKKRIAEQHRAVTEEIRSGALHLSAPPPSVQEAPAEPKSPASASALSLELLNSKTWLAGKHAKLQISVRHKPSGAAVAGAKVVARVEGSARPQDFSAVTNAQGHAQLEFDMPPLASAEPALIIEAAHADAKAQLKFQLKARPRVPVA
ncbi:MAG TPA: hypothetical protein VJN93_04260 [Candidatus Acidoferrum sp.]|nr:hypothetical protein [Candidatus Acidoferrum sp.]